MEKDKLSLEVITAKLGSIVGCTLSLSSDLSVLAEFCEVMLKSKKTREEIVSELDGFLNEAAVPFAEWLVSNAESEILAAKSAKDADPAPDPAPDGGGPSLAVEDHVATEGTLPPEETEAAAHVELPAVQEEELPDAEEETHLAREEAPVAQEEAPVAQEEAPVTQEEAPVTEEDIPIAHEEPHLAHEEASSAVDTTTRDDAPGVQNTIAQDATGTPSAVAPVEPPVAQEAEDIPAAQTAPTTLTAEVVVVREGEGGEGEGDGCVVVVDDDDDAPNKKQGDKGVARARSPVSTDGRDPSSPRLRRETPTLRARRDCKTFLVEKNASGKNASGKKESTRKVYSDRVSPLGNALLMARAVKDATGASENREAPRIRKRAASPLPQPRKRSRVVARRPVRQRTPPRRAPRSPIRRSRSLRIQTRRRKPSRSRSIESFSVHSSDRSPKRRPTPPRKQRVAVPVRPVQKKKVKRVESPKPSPVLVKAKVKRVTQEIPRERVVREDKRAEPIIKSNLDDKELDERIARLERLEKLQEQTRKNREELADMDLPLRVKSSQVAVNPGLPQSQAVSFCSPAALANQPVMIPRRPTSPGSMRRQDPFQVVKWRVIVDSLEVTAGLVKAAGDPVKTLSKGEIVEQTSQQVVDDGVQMIPIAHPSSSKYPAPIGWVTLDSTAVGGQKCLEPGPAFIKGGKHLNFANKGKGKTFSPSYAPPQGKGWWGGKGWSSNTWSPTQSSSYV